MHKSTGKSNVSGNLKGNNKAKYTYSNECTWHSAAEGATVYWEDKNVPKEGTITKLAQSYVTVTVKDEKGKSKNVKREYKSLWYKRELQSTK